MVLRSIVNLLTLALCIIQWNKVLGEEMTQCLNGVTEIKNLNCPGERINIKRVYYAKTKGNCSVSIQPDPNDDCIVNTEAMVRLTRDIRTCNGAEKCLTHYPGVEDYFFDHCGAGFKTVYGHIEYECIPKTNIEYLEFCPRNGSDETEYTGTKFYFYAQDPEGKGTYKSISYARCSCTLNSTSDKFNLKMTIMDFSLKNFGDKSPCPYSVTGDDGFSFSFKHCAIRNTPQLMYDFQTLGKEVQFNITRNSTEQEQELYLYFDFETSNNVTLKCSKPIDKEDPIRKPPTTTITTSPTTADETIPNTVSAQSNQSVTTSNFPLSTTAPFLPPLGATGLGLACGCLFFFITTIVACACACRKRSEREKSDSDYVHTGQRTQQLPPSYLELNSTAAANPPDLPKNHPVLDKPQNDQGYYENTREGQPDYEQSHDYYNHPTDEYLPPRT